MTDERYVHVPESLPRYRELNAAERALIDRVIKLSDQIAALWREIRDADTRDLADSPTFDHVAAGVAVDEDWLVYARYRFEEGTSALIRCVARPRDPYVDGSSPPSSSE